MKEAVVEPRSDAVEIPNDHVINEGTRPSSRGFVRTVLEERREGGDYEGNGQDNPRRNADDKGDYEVQCPYEDDQSDEKENNCDF